MTTVFRKFDILSASGVIIYAPLEKFIYAQQASFPVYSYPVVHKLARAIDEYRGKHVGVHVLFTLIFIFIPVECIDDSGFVCVASVRVVIFLVCKPG